MARLTRVYDDDGAICQLNPELPGVLFDPVTGNPVNRFTEKWARMLQRLYALEGVQDELDRADEAASDEPDVDGFASDASDTEEG